MPPSPTPLTVTVTAYALGNQPTPPTFTCRPATTAARLCKKAMHFLRDRQTDTRSVAKHTTRQALLDRQTHAAAVRHLLSGRIGTAVSMPRPRSPADSMNGSLCGTSTSEPPQPSTGVMYRDSSSRAACMPQSAHLYHAHNSNPISGLCSPHSTPRRASSSGQRPQSMAGASLLLARLRLLQTVGCITPMQRERETSSNTLVRTLHKKPAQPDGVLNLGSCQWHSNRSLTLSHTPANRYQLQISISISDNKRNPQPIQHPASREHQMIRHWVPTHAPSSTTIDPAAPHDSTKRRSTPPMDRMPHPHPRPPSSKPRITPASQRPSSLTLNPLGPPKP